MEGKLIKLGLSKGYRLDDLNGNYIASTLNGKNKLSRRNCEEIEFGFSLVELFNKVDSSIDYHEFDFSSFRLGVKSVLELLGDKKFSEFLDKEKELGISDIKTIERIQWYYKTYFDKSQQTEWDVEIMVDICGDKVYAVPEVVLDENGCLILKRK